MKSDENMLICLFFIDILEKLLQPRGTTQFILMFLSMDPLWFFLLYTCFLFIALPDDTACLYMSALLLQMNAALTGSSG